MGLRRAIERGKQGTRFQGGNRKMVWALIREGDKYRRGRG